jgi:hypothetical protein
VVRERGGGSPGALRIPNARPRTARRTQTVESRCGAGLVRLQTLRIPNARPRTARTTQTVESRCGAGLVRLQTLSAAAHILP